MNSIDTVVYAEGPAELRAERDTNLNLRPRPGQALLEEQFGAVHWLVRRSLAHVTEVPPNAVRFQEPKRTGRAKVAQGSKLLKPQVLRPLMQWTEPPDLAVLVVDRDGEANRNRKQNLQATLRGLSPRPTRVVAVAVEEFEAWLIADISTVQGTLGASVDGPGSPEDLEPGEAKRLLKQWSDDAPTDLDVQPLHRTIAKQLNLDRVRSRCDAFEEFLADLSQSIEHITG